jgi:hypothetical protein
VFVVKSGGRSNLVRALRTLLGIDPSAGGALLSGPQSDEGRQRADGAVVSQVRSCCSVYRELHTRSCWPTSSRGCHHVYRMSGLPSR